MVDYPRFLCAKLSPMSINIFALGNKAERGNCQLARLIWIMR